ncbi:MAG: hypothetical protein LAO78_27495 [Acidobacteriia bacterium]|nr:hypothetical protein [Terriglobia bacterium]
MPRTSRIIEVLIASPSDVQDERNILTEVILDWNSAHSRSVGITLSPVRWEMDAVPATGDRPQGLLNKQIVENADIVVGVFWHRMGTPTGVALSGTAEEIEILRTKGKKVLLYFSEAAIPHNHDRKQLEALKSYRDSLRQDTLYWTFQDRDTFRRVASKHLARVLNELSEHFLPEGSGTLEEETQLRVDAMNVSARITESYSESFALLLTNESSEIVKIRDIRLFSPDRIALAAPHILPLLPQGSNNLIEPNGSLAVRWQPKPNPAMSLVNLNWNSIKREVQTISADMLLDVGCEALKKFKRCETRVRVQLDTWNKRVEQMWM